MLMVETVTLPAGLTPGKYFNTPNPRNTAPRLIRKAVMLFRTPPSGQLDCYRWTITADS